MQKPRIFGATFIALLVALASAIVFTLSGAFDVPSIDPNLQWESPAVRPRDPIITNINNDTTPDIVFQADIGLGVFDADAGLIFSRGLPPNSHVTVIQGDNADDALEVAIYTPDAEVIIQDSNTDELARLSVAETLAGSGQISGLNETQFILVDRETRLAAYTITGELLWTAGPVREQLHSLAHLPDASGGQIIVGSLGGRIAAFDAEGGELWTANLDGELRRLRAFAVDGVGQVFASGVDGQFNVYDALTGEVQWSAELGQTIDEMRAMDLAGDPDTTEIMLGGRDGGLWRYSAEGEQRWGRRVPGGVREIASFTSENYGRILAVGDDTGQVTFFDADGLRLDEIDFGASITLLRTHPDLGNDVLLIGDASRLALWQPSISTSTNLQIPLAGLSLLMALILGMAFLTRRLNIAAPPDASEDAVQQVQARWGLLHQKTQDLSDAHAHGDFSEAEYHEKLRTLRDEMAQLATTLAQHGLSPDIQVIDCPHCGAPVQQGDARCEFCGEALP